MIKLHSPRTRNQVTSIRSSRVAGTPPVMPLTEGKWTMWEEWVADGDDMFFRCTSSHPQGCEEVYYDQKERRQIFVVEPMTIPPRVVLDVDTYGVPALTAHFIEVVDDQIKKEYNASHWLYKKWIPTRGSTGLEAPIPDPNDLPLMMSLKKTSGVSITVINPESTMPSMLNLIPTPSVVTPLLPAKPIPTESRAYCQLEVTRDTGSGSQLLGRRPHTPVEKGEKGETESEQVAKKPQGTEKPDNEQTLAATVTAPIESSTVSPRSTNRPMKRPLVDALSHNSMDSRFLCFKGLTATWKECCSWFYSVAVSSHFVWISRIC